MNKFQIYIEVKLKLNALEEERKKLEMELFDEDWEGLNYHKTSQGTLFYSSRKSYEYYTAVKKQKEHLSRLKKTEELTGVAILEKETSFITFKPNNEN